MEELYLQLLDGIRFLTDEKHIITGLNAAFGSRDRYEELHYGNISEYVFVNGEPVFSPTPAKNDSVYDLASVTKLFTALSVLKLFSEKKFSFDTQLCSLDSHFPGLASYTVYDLLAFQKAISSPERIDAQPDRDSALHILFQSVPSPRPERRFYTDMGAMVLKYVIENVSGRSYYEYLSENILRPLGMNHTFSSVPESLYPNTANYNFERRIGQDGSFSVDTGCPTGTVHDPKARVISPDGRDLCGHAGLFSTAEDLSLLAQALLRGEILPLSLVREIGINRTGFRLPDGDYTHHLGYLCFAKHPVQTYSEVPAFFSDRTIALNGFTGNHFSIDPEQNRFLILLSNRIQNRVTVATGRPDPESTLEKIQWPDGKAYPVSQNYVYYKDNYLKNPAGNILKEKY